MLAIDHKRCLACGGCVGSCPFDALDLNEGRDINVNNDKCTDCQICQRFCPTGALEVILKDGAKKPLPRIKGPNEV